MAITAPGVSDTIKVVDQSSEYKNKTGTVISANETSQYIMVQFSDSHQTVRLRMTQVKVVGAASGGSVTLKKGNNPLGSVRGRADSRYAPKNDERRDAPGKNFNPSDPTGTLGDTRTKLA